MARRALPVIEASHSNFPTLQARPKRSDMNNAFVDTRMATLLGRELTETEAGLRDALAKIPVETLRRSSGKTGTAALEMRNDFYAPALALIHVPVQPGWQRELCESLI